MNFKVFQLYPRFTETLTPNSQSQVFWGNNMKLKGFKMHNNSGVFTVRRDQALSPFLSTKQLNLWIHKWITAWNTYVYYILFDYNPQVFLMPCATSKLLVNLQYLDLSENLLTDMTLEETLCYGDSTIKDLRVLNISRNALKVPSWNLHKKHLQLCRKCVFIDAVHCANSHYTSSLHGQYLWV